MKAPHLEFRRGNRPSSTVGLIALVIATIVLLTTVRYLDALKHEGAALDERESAVAQKEQRFNIISRANNRPASPQMEQLMAQQRYATEPARNLIEKGWRQNIALRTLEVVTASRQINLDFETRTVQEALSYADWLEAQPATESVSVKRQIEKPGPPMKTVETTLQVTWRVFGGQPEAGKPQAAAQPQASANGGRQ